jgi:hypothetical protein
MEAIENFTLANLLNRSDQRRANTERREREDRQARRSQTEENTLSNSGEF